jgi:hypothetical protein
MRGPVDEKHDERTVTDEDIQEIIDQHEAGIGDLIQAYEPVERLYFNAVQQPAPAVTYAIDTNPR